MLYQLLIGAGLAVLGYYVGQQVERDAPTRERLRKRREEREREEKKAISDKEQEPPSSS